MGTDVLDSTRQERSIKWPSTINMDHWTVQIPGKRAFQSPIIDDSSTTHRLHPLNPFGPTFLSPTSTAGVKLLPCDQRLRVAEQGFWAENGQHHQLSEFWCRQMGIKILVNQHSDGHGIGITAMVTGFGDTTMAAGRVCWKMFKRWPCFSPSIPKQLLGSR